MLLESKLFHFHGELWEIVGKIVKSNPTLQIRNPSPKFLDLTFDLLYIRSALWVCKITQYTPEKGPIYLYLVKAHTFLISMFIDKR